MPALTRWGFDRQAGAKARPVPLVRAYRGHRRTEFAVTAGVNATADSARGCEGSAPEGSSGAPAGVVVNPANADQMHQPLGTVPPLDPVRRAARALGLDKQVPAIDPARVAAAFRAKPRAAMPAPARALAPAPSREACHRCGVPGWRGCDHQLPFEGPPVQVHRGNSEPHKCGKHA